MKRTRAIVRTPSPRVADGQVTHLERVPMDVERAFAQHGVYVDTLRSLGVGIIEAPAAPEFPDGVFVEDVLVMIDDLAVVTRPGAPSRSGEVDSIRALVHALDLKTVSIEAPATVDGGDVMVTDRHVFVGQSTRSNAASVEQFNAHGGPSREAIGVTTDKCLHLKSGITTLPDGSLIGFADWIDLSPFRSLGYVVHEAPEPGGADVLWIENTVVVPIQAVASAAFVRSLGFDVVTIDVSELQKIEAGMTCMSVLI